MHLRLGKFDSYMVHHKEGDSCMTVEERINQLKIRIALLESRGDKNIKAPGTLQKLKRKLYKLEQI